MAIQQKCKGKYTTKISPAPLHGINICYIGTTCGYANVLIFCTGQDQRYINLIRVRDFQNCRPYLTFNLAFLVMFIRPQITAPKYPDVNQSRCGGPTQNSSVFSRWCNLVDFKGPVADTGFLFQFDIYTISWHL